MMQVIKRFLEAVSSLRLTLICLGAAFVLVFCGTLAQRQLDTFHVQTTYFQSWFVFWPITPDFAFPIFPGGHLIGAVLLTNLITAHIRRFSWTWKKLGIQLTHVGLIIMLGGGLATDLLSVSSFMVIPLNGTSNFSYDPQRTELAISKTIDPTSEDVTAIPSDVISQGGTISHKNLPFNIVVRGFYQNSMLSNVEQGAASTAAANGFGTRTSVRPVPPATRKGQSNITSTVIEIVSIDGGASLGTWLVSNAMGAPQEFNLAGHRWTLELRYARYYKPYSLTLDKIDHDVYPGTEIAKNYSSAVTLNDPVNHEQRKVLIWMNHPLRYQGDTYYQNGQDGNTTILQVVNNPSFLAPYIACVIVGLGLIFQFGYHLILFVLRNQANSSSAP